ncbi:hypothetical protein LEP1GSC188_3627 [Leptospira weilii serovar Topaz str. LT2116]|uniref:Uncharacterized protein n=1 Tax=Leptospira weilii serovar Topaz str. LT2116 TaxID=1088540 RepID=M3GWB2_9LEPT|nr:hypothetical protein LEP1GSC188_3627 [Leptospira weilii serovar Topaz str. LT2116]
MGVGLIDDLSEILQRACPKTIRSYQNLHESLQLFLRFGTDSDSKSKF